MHSEQITKITEKKKLMEIYQLYKNRMYISARRIVKDPYLAEDAVHDAFVAISKNIDKIDDVESLKTASYVIKAAKSRAYNILKKNYAENLNLISEEDAQYYKDSLDAISTAENYSYIVSAVMKLSEKYRDVLSLYYFNELTVSEIADLTGKKENTVKQQLARGRRKLINLIKEEENCNEKEPDA